MINPIYTQKIECFQKMISAKQQIKRKVLEDGRNFRNIGYENIDDEYKNVWFNDYHRKLTIPNRFCGFELFVLQRNPLYFRMKHDRRAVISLALISPKTRCLAAYANKLPIMSINAYRYFYTRQIFEICRGDAIDLNESVLDFYISTDLQMRIESLPANEQFSETLHRLRCNGYERYFVELARKFQINLDLVYDSKLVYRYLYVVSSTIYNEPQQAVVHKKTKKTNTTPFITAALSDDGWVVCGSIGAKITESKIVDD